MNSLLIKDTTREERAKIVSDALGGCGSCDGCGACGSADMYEAYINGEKEIKDINMEYRAKYAH